MRATASFLRPIVFEVFGDQSTRGKTAQGELIALLWKRPEFVLHLARDIGVYTDAIRVDDFVKLVRQLLYTDCTTDKVIGLLITGCSSDVEDNALRKIFSVYSDTPPSGDRKDMEYWIKRGRAVFRPTFDGQIANQDQNYLYYGTDRGFAIADYIPLLSTFSGRNVVRDDLVQEPSMAKFVAKCYDTYVSALHGAQLIKFRNDPQLYTIAPGELCLAPVANMGSFMIPHYRLCRYVACDMSWEWVETYPGSTFRMSKGYVISLNHIIHTNQRYPFKDRIWGRLTEILNYHFLINQRSFCRFNTGWVSFEDPISKRDVVFITF